MTANCSVVPPVRALTSAVAVFAVLVLLGGCGGDDEAARVAEPVATAAPASSAPEELVGTWTRRFTERDVGDSGFPTGGYTLKIRENAVIDIYEGPDSDPTQECIAQEHCFPVELDGSGRVLTLGETGTCAGVARYTFVVKGEMLTTKAVDEDCGRGRPVIFDGRTWKRAD